MFPFNYNTHSLENLLKNYERVAERFKSLNINSVRIGVYDLTSNPPPPSIEIYTTPMIVFLPAYQKSPPFKVYTDSPKELFFSNIEIILLGVNFNVIY